MTEWGKNPRVVTLNICQHSNVSSCHKLAQSSSIWDAPSGNHSLTRCGDFYSVFKVYVLIVYN